MGEMKQDKDIATKICVYCNRPANTKDHVIPKSLGGKKTVDCCARCNQAKANFYLSDFLLVFTDKNNRKKRLRFKRFYHEFERELITQNIEKLISQQ